MTHPAHGHQIHESGIHHVTALKSDPAKNAAFYVGLQRIETTRMAGTEARQHCCNSARPGH